MREMEMLKQKGTTAGTPPVILHVLKVEFFSTHLPMLAILALIAAGTRLAWDVAMGDVEVVTGIAVGAWLACLAVWVGRRIDAWEVGHG